MKICILENLHFGLAEMIAASCNAVACWAERTIAACYIFVHEKTTLHYFVEILKPTK
jgi:hypothetical protein